MTDQIEKLLRDFSVSLQVAKIYTVKHPKFRESITKTHETLLRLFGERNELIIGIIGEEFAFEKEIFFDLSKKLKGVIAILKMRGIERIVFHKRLNIQDLTQFINLLAMPLKEQIDVEGYFKVMEIKNIEVSAIRLPKGIYQGSDYQKNYEAALDAVLNLMDSVLGKGSLDQFELKFILLNIVENLVEKYQGFLKLATVKKFDVSTFAHLLNTAILALHFTSKLGFSKEDCLEIGVGALFHDIGKLYISRQVIKKRVSLTEEEYFSIKSHTILGAEFLLSYVDSLGATSVVTAFEHHLGYDLSGYPKLKFPLVPHLCSFITSICDVYDALFQRRSYKRDYPPNMVYDIMLRERGRLFHPELLDKFYTIMGVWPVGSVVALSDSRIAIVREENEDDIFSPTVEVVFPQEQKEQLDTFAALKTRPLGGDKKAPLSINPEQTPPLKGGGGEWVDLKKNKTLTIVRSLNPLDEGKQYLDLI